MIQENNESITSTFFLFRTHAHALGAVITGYRVRDGQFVEVARGDPQRPQTFYPMERFEVARKGDIMAARCTFDGTRTNKTTTIGKSKYVSPWAKKLTPGLVNLFLLW